VAGRGRSAAPGGGRRYCSGEGGRPGCALGRGVVRVCRQGGDGELRRTGERLGGKFGCRLEGCGGAPLVARWCGPVPWRGVLRVEARGRPPYRRPARRLASSGPKARLGNARTWRRRTDRKVMRGVVRRRDVPSTLGMRAAWGRGPRPREGAPRVTHHPWGRGPAAPRAGVVAAGAVRRRGPK
jgi:hypothetical protein